MVPKKNAGLSFGAKSTLRNQGVTNQVMRKKKQQAQILPYKDIIKRLKAANDLMLDRIIKAKPPRQGLSSDVSEFSKEAIFSIIGKKRESGRKRYSTALAGIKSRSKRYEVIKLMEMYTLIRSKYKKLRIST